MGFVTQQDAPVNPHSVEKIIYHRNYKPKTMGNDIALIKLAAPLVLNGNLFFLSILSLLLFFFMVKSRGDSSVADQKFS